MMKTKLLILVAVAVIAAMATATAFAVSSDSTAPTGQSGPAAVSQVPAALPAQGVTIDPAAEILLMPAAAGAQAMAAVSADMAVNLGPKIPTPLAPTAVLATVTIGATVPPVGTTSKGYADIEGRLAWVITYTYPEPVDVRIGGAPDPNATAATSKPSPLLMSHANVIIDAQTGAFLWGFFTK